MSLTTIVSYDGSARDRDALALAGVFAHLGADTVLVYVRHTATDLDSAQELLDDGAAGFIVAETRVVVNPSTSAGLQGLAAETGAGLIIFGSDYRTPAGRVGFQKSAQRLLDSGNTAIAIAPSGYTPGPIETVGLIADLDDHATIDTTAALARRYGATVTDSVHDVDLLIVGSRAEAGEGKVLLSARAEITIEEEAAAPVLVVARGVALNPQQEFAVA